MMDTSQLTPQLQALLQSPEAQQLRQLLLRSCGSTVQQAAQAMQRGDESEARALLAPLLQDAQTAELLGRLSAKGGV